MKLTFLGTGHGVPAKGRNCQCIMIEAGGKIYLFDGGAPVMHIFLERGYDFRKIQGIFMTHRDSDHTLGFMHLVNLSNWYYKDMSYQMFFSDEEYMHNFLKVACGTTQLTGRINTTVFGEGLVYEDENIKVSSVLTKHLADAGFGSYGFIVEADGKRIFISGDLHGDLIDFPEIANREKFDIAIFENAHFKHAELAKHLTDCKADKLMFIHVFPLEQYDAIKESAKTLPCEVICPNDYDSFEI